MADGTGIEWTDATWNPVRGCSRKSEGCRFCYAEPIAARFSGEGLPYHGFADRGRAGSKWTGKVELVPSALHLPLHWRKPRRIFVNSMSDLFHENLPDVEIDQVFAVMALSVQHCMQVLTKRPDRMRSYCEDPATPLRVWLAAGEIMDPLWALGVHGAHWGGDTPWPLRNVWLGVSIEDQPAADGRVNDLLATPAAKRFLSCEPLLGEIDLLDIPWPADRPRFPVTDDLSDSRSCLHQIEGSRIDWVIVGGESGTNARPMHPDWARALREQCMAAGVPFFFKQRGEWTWVDDADFDANRIPEGWPLKLNDGEPMWRVGKKIAGALLDGREHREFPA
jgi:protein gp37